MIANQIQALDILAKNATRTKDLDKLDDNIKKIETKVKECDELHQRRVALLSETLNKLTRILEEERSASAV